MSLFLVLIAGILMFSGCAEDNYNSGYYDPQKSSYDRKMEYEARKDMQEASKMLSEKDIKNLENMKK
jgi:hypothetical protein